MNQKRVFWKRILFLFTFTFLAAFIQQKVNEDFFAQKTTSSIKNDSVNTTNNATTISQESQFQSVPFFEGNARRNTTIKPSRKVLEEQVENITLLPSKTKFSIYNFSFYFETFAKYFAFYFYESFEPYSKLYSQICCWRI